MDLKDRIAAVRENLGHSQKAMAAIVGVDVTSWQRYENGKMEPRAEQLTKLAAKGFNINWLLTGKGEMLLEDLSNQVWLLNELEGMGYVHLPYFNVDATAGNGSLVEIEQPVRRMGFQREWLNREIGANPANLILLNSKGDSMSSLIRDEDLLMVDTSEPKLRSGKPIYVFVHDGMLFVKRLEARIDGGLIVTSDNSELYKPEVLSPDQARDINIIGRVVWNARKV